MTQTDEIRQVQEAARSIRQNTGHVIVGKEGVTDLLMVALLCEGHVLFEDVPGIGKTTMAKALAKSLGCSFQRIQFTPDLLPRTSPVSLSTIKKKVNSNSGRDRYSHRSCSPTKSTALHPVRNQLSWKQWMSDR